MLIAPAILSLLALSTPALGMYGFMALGQFVLLPALGVPRAEVDTVEFWFLMQLAMMTGFATAYPVNWWLVRAGIKERM